MRRGKHDLCVVVQYPRCCLFPAYPAHAPGEGAVYGMYMLLTIRT